MNEEVQTGRNHIANIADIADIANIANIADIENPIANIAETNKVNNCVAVDICVFINVQDIYLL